MNPLVSIVVPSYRSEKTIFSTLDSLMNQRTTVPYEIIVADDTPGNFHLEIEEKFPSVKIIHQNKKTSAGSARNIGIEKAAGEIVIFIDADAFAYPDLVDKAVSEIRKGHLVTGGCVDVANPLNLIGWSCYLVEFHEFFPESPRGKRASICSVCIVVKKEILDKYGGFRSEDISAEDLLFSSKLVNNNVELYFSPDLRVSHFNRENLTSVLKAQYKLGIGGALVRRTYKLKNDIIIRLPILIPLVGLYKYASIFIKLLRCSRKKLLLYLLLTPLIALNLMAYTVGFLKGKFQKNPLTQD